MNIGLIFGMVVAILVMGMIFVFSYQQLNNVTEIQKTAEFRKALSNLGSSVDRIYNQGGESSEKHSLSFPAKVFNCSAELLPT